MEPNPEAVRRVVRLALDEDLGSRGDLTSDSVLDAETRAIGRLIARQDLVLAGLPLAREVFRCLDASLAFEAASADGDDVGAGSCVATVRGWAHPILVGERTALNFLMRMSGIATAAHAAVAEVAGTGTRILDTRKTAPGLRELDKYAVAAGGAVNHRHGLYDEVMIKDTHLQAVASITEAVRRARACGHPAEIITVEVGNLEQLREAIEAGAGRVLLDNMDLETMTEAVRVADGRVIIEASGGLRPGKLRQVAATGVDFISLGWLTHSAPAADLAMDLEIES
jgi:nicotinate-nucleotide pyrophosphorylase (carboxylating)